MKKLFFLTILSIMGSFLFGQEIKTDSLKLEYEKYEISIQDIPLMGKQKIITGTVIIKKNKKKLQLMILLFQ